MRRLGGILVYGLKWHGPLVVFTFCMFTADGQLSQILPCAHHGKQKPPSLVAPTSIAVTSKQSAVLVAEGFQAAMVTRMPRQEADDWSDQYTWSDANGRASETAETIHLPERMSRDDNAESDPDQMPGLTNPFDDPTDTPSEPCWICRSCGSPDWRRMNAGYRCAQCGGMSFTTAGSGPFPPKQTAGGTWVFVAGPSGPPHNRRSVGTQQDFGASVVGRRASKHGEPYDPGNHGFDSEQAESETLTHDASIDPDTMKPLSRRQRRAKKKKAAKQDTTTMPMSRPSTSSSSSDPKKVSKWRDDMLAGLNA